MHMIDLNDHSLFWPRKADRTTDMALGLSLAALNPAYATEVKVRPLS